MDRRDGVLVRYGHRREGAQWQERRAQRRWWYEYKRVMSWHQDGRVDPACHSQE